MREPTGAPLSEHKTIRRGRPRATEQRTSVSTWLPAKDADRLIEIAKRRELSVSAVLRRIVFIQLRGEE